MPNRLSANELRWLDLYVAVKQSTLQVSDRAIVDLICTALAESEDHRCD